MKRRPKPSTAPPNRLSGTDRHYLPSGIVHHGYDRCRDLPRLLPLWPDELADVSLDGHTRLIARLASLLRRERQRGLAGDWCYDLARHRQLVVAYRSELAAWRHDCRNR